jgi:hypothetical protein
MERRKYLELKIPAKGELPADGLRVNVDFDIALMDSKIVDGGTPALPLRDGVKYIASTKQLDFESHVFRDWMRDNGLHRLSDESVYDYAHRIFRFLVARSEYVSGGDYESRQPSRFCKSLKGDCGGMSLAFCGVMRSAGIPARPLFGRWALSETSDYGQTHVIAEFWDDALGWVPVDVASAVVHFSKMPDRVFGATDGQFIAFHENTDVEPRPGLWQGWAQYALVFYHGTGDFRLKYEEKWTVTPRTPANETNK